MFWNCSLTVRTLAEREIPLRSEKPHIYRAPDAEATLYVERVGDCDVLYASAALWGAGETFHPDNALTVRFSPRPAPFVAVAMHKEYWSRPSFGGAWREVPPRTQALIWKEEEKWHCLLPLCGAQYTCTLAGGDDGVEARVYSYADTLSALAEMPCVVSAVGDDPHKTVAQAAAAAAEVLGDRAHTVREKTYPELFEYLGWCSWDALQIRVNERGLLEKCAEIKEKNIPIRWCIIDDMWAEVKGLNDLPADIPFSDMVAVMRKSKLYALRADPDRFPHGLAACVEKLHGEGLSVGIWYPTTGYWCGMDPDGEIPKTLSDALITLPDGRIAVKPTFEGAHAFHGAMQKMLKEAGADFVKIDNQGHYRNFYRHVAPVGEAAGGVQRAIEEVTNENFGDTLINCMGMPNECMFNRGMSAVSRCSDDFLPENREWFTKHVLQCSYNSLVQGQFFFSDWDMWWTDDGQAMKNAVCRAVSGGPVYVSDKIGRSRPEILTKLAFRDGRLLRADGQATPTADCLLDDPRASGKPFKIFNRAGNAAVVAAFNLSEENLPQTGMLFPHDAGITAERCLAVEQITGENRILERGEGISLTLPDQDTFRLYLLFPLADGVTPVGRIDKWISPKAVVAQTETGVTLYEGGPLALCGVSAIATGKRARVEGKRDGVLYRFDLDADETEIRYLERETAEKA